ncbi:MAG: hypothetical protein ACRELD_14080 [Longimicrobiales bacterium]
MISTITRALTRPEPAIGRLADSAEVRRARWIPVVGGRMAGMRGAAGAVTLGCVIVVHPDVPLTPRLLRHELAHVRQWQRYPFTFALRYAWNHLRHGYHANPYEVEARRAEREALDDDATAAPGRSA